MTEATMIEANVIGASIMALGDTASSFTGDGNGVSIHDFVHVLEEVRRLGGWTDGQLMGIAGCKMVSAAYNFAWQNEAAAPAKTYAKFKNRAGKQCDTEPE